MRLLFIYVFISISIGCQTSMYQQFEQVNVGMDKDDVLQIMGSPQRTQRWRGKDRWTFVFYEDRIRFEKEVQFQEGVATYVGQTWQPPKEESAEYVDQKNKERSEYLDKIAYQPILPEPRPQNTSIFDSHQQNQSELNSQNRNENSNNNKTFIYVPTFEPISENKSIETTSGSR